MRASMWRIEKAKGKLPLALQRAREGEQQIIGAREPCVIISMQRAWLGSPRYVTCNEFRRQ